MDLRQNWPKAVFFLVVSLAAVGCGNGGKIRFRTPASSEPRNLNSAFRISPASEAMVSTNPADPTTGYHGKLEYNTLRGQNMQATGGYTARMKYSTRNR